MVLSHFNTRAWMWCSVSREGALDASKRSVPSLAPRRAMPQRSAVVDALGNALAFAEGAKCGPAEESETGHGSVR